MVSRLSLEVFRGSQHTLRPNGNGRSLILFGNRAWQPPFTGMEREAWPHRGLKLPRPSQRTSNPQRRYFRSEYCASVFLISTRAAIESGIPHLARAASTAVMA